jgi:hypothetical protein
MGPPQQWYPQNEDKINTNVSTFVYYEQALCYMFRLFLGHHQYQTMFLN